MPPRRKIPTRRVLVVWILLLACAQGADVLTTAVDLQHGGIEANAVVARLLAMGGMGLVIACKVALVGAVALAVLLLQRLAWRQPMRAVMAAQRMVWRGLQMAVVGLLLVAGHNAVLLFQIG
jgi:uncharacterized protein DUF5658